MEAAPALSNSFDSDAIYDSAFFIAGTQSRRRPSNIFASPIPIAGRLLLVARLHENSRGRTKKSLDRLIQSDFSLLQQSSPNPPPSPPPQAATDSFPQLVSTHQPTCFTPSNNTFSIARVLSLAGDALSMNRRPVSCPLCSDCQFFCPFSGFVVCFDYPRACRQTHYPTAINAAVDGDVILVAPALTLKTSISQQSNHVTKRRWRFLTIIDGQNLVRRLTFGDATGESQTLRDSRFQHAPPPSARAFSLGASPASSITFSANATGNGVSVLPSE